ncbi:hypothetical protein LIER_27921 [Lithospermum erythrorhizon]|uniref:Uncharacterized protein n=1 Tax=Lithospermum erythrorhizon TaxID=34254 RepID=A0AAV3RE24_LITER
MEPCFPSSSAQHPTSPPPNSIKEGSMHSQRVQAPLQTSSNPLIETNQTTNTFALAYAPHSKNTSSPPPHDFMVDEGFRPTQENLALSPLHLPKSSIAIRNTAYTNHIAIHSNSYALQPIAPSSNSHAPPSNNLLDLHATHPTNFTTKPDTHPSVPLRNPNMPPTTIQQVPPHNHKPTTTMLATPIITITEKPHATKTAGDSLETHVQEPAEFPTEIHATL